MLVHIRMVSHVLVEGEVVEEVVEEGVEIKVVRRRAKVTLE